MSLRNQPKIYEANRRPKGRHLLFCFISFIGIYYPLTTIVIVHIVCNPSDHSFAHSFYGDAFYYLVLRMQPLPEAGNNYLGIECDHLPEAVNNI